jgi:hypothetical protein
MTATVPLPALMRWLFPTTWARVLKEQRANRDTITEQEARIFKLTTQMAAFDLDGDGKVGGSRKKAG